MDEDKRKTEENNLFLKKVNQKEENKKPNIENLAETYIEFLNQRFSGWSPDWCADGQIQNPKTRFIRHGNGAEITVSEKSLMSKKDKVKIVVKTVDGTHEKDLDLMLSSIKNEPGIYHLLVVIGKEFDLGALQYADSFKNPNASLFLVEPSKHVIFMDEKPVTKMYSAWLDSSKAPQKLKEILKEFAKEKAHGKQAITIKQASEKFGLKKEEALLFLKSCKFLKQEEGKDKFYFVG